MTLIEFSSNTLDRLKRRKLNEDEPLDSVIIRALDVLEKEFTIFQLQQIDYKWNNDSSRKSC